jgi:hypothetical protein
VTDQNGDPVPDVIISFCSGSACTIVELDETGTGSYTAPAASYHVTFVEVPEGYNTDNVPDLYTDEHSSSISITITKE